VSELLDGTLRLTYRSDKLEWRELPARPEKPREKGKEEGPASRRISPQQHTPGDVAARAASHSVGAGLRSGSLRSPARSPAPTQNVTFLSCHTL